MLQHLMVIKATVKKNMRKGIIQLKFLSFIVIKQIQLTEIKDT